MPKTIAIVSKTDDSLALRNAQSLLEHGVLKGLELQLGLPNETDDIDLVICIGGDGTLLATIRKVGNLRHRALFLGVHGSKGLGFLHTVRQPEESEDPKVWATNLLDMLMNREYVGESRWGLETEVWNQQNTRCLDKFWALNDVVLGKGSLSRMIEMKLSLGEQVIIPRLRGDGLIISSPTGSTAYSLSAGGPVMDPALRGALLLTPVCSHSMGLRPVVINADRELRVERLDENTSGMLTADGQEGMDFAMGQIVKIKMSHLPVRFLIPHSKNFPSMNYFDVLRAKLGFGRDRYVG